MTVVRRSDEALGWAVQIMGTFRFGTRTMPAGIWIVELHGTRTVVTARAFTERFATFHACLREGRAS